MKKFFKALGIIFGGLIGLIIVVYIILDITFSIQLHNKINELKAQGKPTTIAEIIPPPIPDEENAAILYNKALAEKHFWIMLASIREEDMKKGIEIKIFSDISEWSDEQRNEIPKLINSKEMQDIYELLEKGSQKPKCNFNLEYEKGPDITLPNLNHMRDAMRLLCLRALLEAEENNVEKAFDTLLVGFKISNHLKDELLLVSQLVRISCDNIIIECIKGISDSKGIPLEKAKLIMDKLYYRTDVESFIKTMDGERVCYGVWTFERALKGEISVWRSCGCWDVPLDVAIYESSLNKSALKSDFLCYLTLFSKIQEYYNLPYYEIAKEIKNNPIEKQIPRYCFFTKILLPAYDRPREQIATYQANIDVCRTGLALKIYKAKNGTYPGTLSFLNELPIDPFSGKELIYRKSADGFILYSLGPNMKDDGGTPKAKEYKEPAYNDYDIVWECEK